MQISPSLRRKGLHQCIARRSAGGFNQIDIRNVLYGFSGSTTHSYDVHPARRVAELRIGTSGAFVLDKREEVVVEIERNVAGADDEERYRDGHPAHGAASLGRRAGRATEPSVHACRECNAVNAERDTLHEQRG